MKKIWILMLILGLLSGCRHSEPATYTTQAEPHHPLDAMTLPQIMESIYTKEPVELSLGNIDVDLQDPYAVESYLGLQSADGIKEALASESMFGAQAYSLVLCRVEDGIDPQQIARAMAEGIDQRKWVCVHADDMKVSVSGRVIMLIMLSSEYADSATAQSLTEAFRQVSGGTLTAQIR